MNLVITDFITPLIVTIIGIVVTVIVNRHNQGGRPANKKVVILIYAALIVIILVWCVVLYSIDKPTPPEPTHSDPPDTPTPVSELDYPDTAWTPPEGSSPSRQDLDSVNNDKKYPNEINYPQSSSYLSKYEIKYVKSEYGHSIYLFSDPKCSMDTKRNHYVYEGYAVTVIACEGGASCIIYMNPEGHAISGWVESGFLVYG